jgi:hypothetical protein
MGCSSELNSCKKQYLLAEPAFPIDSFSVIEPRGQLDSGTENLSSEAGAPAND